MNKIEDESYQAYFKSLSELYRLMVIDRCLGGPEPLTTEDIMCECNDILDEEGMKSVTINTTRNDIDNIKKLWNVELEVVKEGKFVKYRYKDSSFSIFKQMFDVEQMQQIQSMIQLLFYFNKQNGMEWTKDIAENLQNAFGLNWISSDFISYDVNPLSIGADMMMPLVEAIGKKKPVVIMYKAFRWEEEKQIIVHPYFLKQYNNCWYLMALNAETMELQIFGLDRVFDISNAEGVKYIATDADFNSYFSEIIGVTRNANTKPRNILLKVSSKFWPYLVNNPIHESQKIKKDLEISSTDSSHVLVQLSVCENTELYKVLLSNIQEIEIVKPDDLRERFANILKKACDKHSINNE